jgi:tetratricopeptide (TPR) repeat protein
MPTQNFFTRKPLSAALRLLVLAAALSVSVAHADDYADVSRLMRAGQFPEALAKVDQYLATKPRDPQMRFFKGVIQTETGKANEAIATFTKITEDYPELPEPYNNMAVLYAGQSQFDKARAALEMAIRTNPSYATAHENLGGLCPPGQPGLQQGLATRRRQRGRSAQAGPDPQPVLRRYQGPAASGRQARCRRPVFEPGDGRTRRQARACRTRFHRRSACRNTSAGSNPRTGRHAGARRQRRRKRR